MKGGDGGSGDWKIIMDLCSCSPVGHALLAVVQSSYVGMRSVFVVYFAS